MTVDQIVKMIQNKEPMAAIEKAIIVFGQECHSIGFKAGDNFRKQVDAAAIKP